MFATAIRLLCSCCIHSASSICGQLSWELPESVAVRLQGLIKVALLCSAGSKTYPERVADAGASSRS